MDLQRNGFGKFSNDKLLCLARLFDFLGGQGVEGDGAERVVAEGGEKADGEEVVDGAREHVLELGVEMVGLGEDDIGDEGGSEWGLGVEAVVADEGGEELALEVRETAEGFLAWGLECLDGVEMGKVGAVGAGEELVGQGEGEADVARGRGDFLG